MCIASVTLTSQSAQDTTVQMAGDDVELPEDLAKMVDKGEKEN